MSKNQRIIGFDFGTKRIGVATGNENTKTSQALSTLKSNNGIPDDQGLNQIIAQWQPTKLVVGLPISLDGHETSMSRQARQFGEHLTMQTGLPVVYVDERLSSVAADQLIQESTPLGKKMTKKRKSERDNLAAQLILQTYFDEN